MIPTEFNRKIAEIRDDRVRGASELARFGLVILAQAARELPAATVGEWWEGLSALAVDLAEARPSMTPLSHLLRRWREGAAIEADMNLAAARQVAAARAEVLIEQSRRAVADCAARVAELVGAGRTLMTHSFSSTVLESCRLLKEAGLRMIVTESRPLEEGRRLAEQLSVWKVPTVYITDAQMALFVARADAVLVGADSVLADGAVLNKAGTALLALAARERGVPFYVACESFKWRDAADPPPVLEEMAPAELGVPTWPDVTVRNLYFEVTPARLISAWIDEAGVRRIAG
ncbi:MAG TPA: translation initiation factor eIF-2B [Candidatus Competibacter sp.]|nr:translation initiation factor eIF-2B [Candidatus Competibacter sp.]HUM95544.1 translation initiation factor eIF-2B [Candidatus Competibacter sp.]